MRTKTPLYLIALALAAIAAPLVFPGAVASEESEALMVAKGKVTFRIYCSNCHGEKGYGDGSLAELLTVRPSNLTAIARDNGGTFPTDRIRALVDGRKTVKGHGLKEMPIWGDAFQKTLQPTWTDESDEDRAMRKIHEVVAYLESIQELEAASE